MDNTTIMDTEPGALAPLVGLGAPKRPVVRALHHHMLAQSRAFLAGNLETQAIPESVPRPDPNRVAVEA